MIQLESIDQQLKTFSRVLTETKDHQHAGYIELTERINQIDLLTTPIRTNLQNVSHLEEDLAMMSLSIQATQKLVYELDLLTGSL